MREQDRARVLNLLDDIDATSAELAARRDQHDSTSRIMRQKLRRQNTHLAELMDNHDEQE